MSSLIAIDAPDHRYGIRQSIRSELIKLSTLRSTLWTLLVTLIGAWVVTFLATNSATHHSPAWYQGFDPTNQSMTGLLVPSLTLGVLGVLAITGEYGTGAIRSSLSATPRRGLFVAAKVIMVGGFALLVGEVLTFSCFGIGQTVLHAGGAPSASLGQPGVLRVVLLSGVCLALFGLMGLGLGFVIRNTAGALASYAGITFLLPFVLQRIPGDPARFTPIPIMANSVAAVIPQGQQVSAPAGFALIAMYAAVLLVVGGASVIRRDA